MTAGSKSALVRRARDVIVQPANSWAVELPADFDARKQKVGDALRAAEELLEQVNGKYSKQVKLDSLPEDMERVYERLRPTLTPRTLPIIRMARARRVRPQTP